MKRPLQGLGLVALLAIGSSAFAVQLSSSGSGQVLLYPIDEADRLDTLISVRNTTSAAKAVKVMVREGQLQIGCESGYLGPEGDLSGSGAQLAGLPIIGLSLHRVRNGTLVDGEGNALLSNYGVMTRASARARVLTSDSR